MSILINAYKLTKSFSSRPLFEELTFSIESGEKIGLIGPNGSGKSTLLRILSSRDSADSGTISFEKGLQIGHLEQVPTFQKGATVQSSLLETLIDVNKDVNKDVNNNINNWEEMALVNELMSKLSLPSADTLVATLSGGWKKRVALARELVRRPDLLLLDEPTNHLDIESIIWLEEFLSQSIFSTLTITHDRLFLQRISNRIIELDGRNPGGLLQVKGDYLTYLKIKEEKMAAQEQEEIKLKNTLRRETEWLAQGAKARTTKQQARIQRASKLEKEVEELTYRNQNLKVYIDFQTAEKNPKKLIEAKAISKSYGDNLIFPPLDLIISPKSRIGLLGPNGCGKSTLLKVLIGEEKPDEGEVLFAEQLQVAWFMQSRDFLDPEVTVVNTICPSGDFVDYRGTKVHVYGYLGRFLFNKEQMDMPVGKLSGGEQSRLCIAKLMLKKANLLVLDEPTNDLDISTLNILQEVLQEFSGAILLVTHDRYFLDQVTSQILTFHQDACNPCKKKHILSFTGLGQWELWCQQQQQQQQKLSTPLANKGNIRDNIKDNIKGTSPNKKRKKLSFSEQKELDCMEETILAAEARLSQLERDSLLPQNASESKKLAEISKKMAEAQQEIDRLYDRWEILVADT